MKKFKQSYHVTVETLDHMTNDQVKVIGRRLQKAMESVLLEEGFVEGQLDVEFKLYRRGMRKGHTGGGVHAKKGRASMCNRKRRKENGY